MNEGQGWVSPKKTLFLSRQWASASVLESPSAKPKYKQGAKPSEVYGFVGLISTTVASVVFFVWAYFPEVWLHSIGITYYPSRYWAVAVPAYVMVTIMFVVVAYISLNHVATPPPNSLSTIFDEFTRPPVMHKRPSSYDLDQPIHPISDLPLTEWLCLDTHDILLFS